MPKTGKPAPFCPASKPRVASRRGGLVLPLLLACAVLTSAGRAAPSWEESLAKRRLWWSLQPLRETPVPDAPAGAAGKSGASAAEWSAHPVDRFLAAGMEARGLRPVEDAGAEVVARRLHFLLTGLPPSVEALESFSSPYKADPAAAVAARGAELMATRAFGERWARHWMDLVRFAETHGSEGDPAIPSAWRYRDYLIRAFNADVPVHRLIREHVAGDLLPDPRWNVEEGFNESILGTAHFRLVEHGFQPVDSLDEQVKTVDSQIDVLTKAFQGLTVSCARCHDHKFDAVSQRDYYALFGVLAGARPGQVTIDAPDVLTKHDARLTELKTGLRRTLAAAWSAAAEAVPGRLLAQESRVAELAQAVAGEAEFRSVVESLEKAARERALAARRLESEKEGAVAGDGGGAATSSGVFSAEAGALPVPWARWTFSSDAADSRGKLSGSLEGGAEIKGGRLVLNGSTAFVRTGPLPETLVAKTFEAWVILKDPDQSGGGVLTVEKDHGAAFDSLVYAEKQPRQWMAGSESWVRTRPVPEARESGAADHAVHVACVYDGQGKIQLYREGVACGMPYQSSGPVTWPAGAAQVLLGRRHTGGNKAFLSGEIEEARLYNRALSAREIESSWKAGPEALTEAEMLTAMPPAEHQQLEKARADHAGAVARLNGLRDSDPLASAWDKALEEAAKDASSPLHVWSLQRAGLPGKAPETPPLAPAAPLAADGVKWLPPVDAAEWRAFGTHVSMAKEGGFFIPPDPEPRVLTGLEPAGRVSHGISTRHNGVLLSPEFILGPHLHVKAWGGGNARVRVMVDHYPIGSNGTWPQAALTEGAAKWLSFDTTYRKGSRAYLEFATDGDSTMASANTGAARSWFGVAAAVVSESPVPPAEPAAGVSAVILTAAAAPDRGVLAAAIGAELRRCAEAFGADALTEGDRMFLDFFVRLGLLPSALPDKTAQAEYRALEAQLPTPRRAPGVFESGAFDAPLFVRGDHHKPAGTVPRGYLEVLGGIRPAQGAGGRLELAEALASDANPLTSRVMVNRVWLQVFGRGLVPTPDDFGKMGEAPTHPELLDHLAARFVRDGWSVKKMLSWLISARAFRLSSTPDAAAAERDAANDFLSHFRVRRLEAEAIRDSLLTWSGQLESGRGGPGADAAAEPEQQTRRSVELTIRRTALPAFLGVFDMPVPFSTLGRRNVTTVPAQSLAMMNDPFVIHCARQAASREWREHPQARPEERAARLFRGILGRTPTPAEVEECLAYGRGSGSLEEEAAWADLVQALFNAKEFIYLL